MTVIDIHTKAEIAPAQMRLWTHDLALATRVATAPGLVRTGAGGWPRYSPAIGRLTATTPARAMASRRDRRERTTANSAATKNPLRASKPTMASMRPITRGT